MEVFVACGNGPDPLTMEASGNERRLVLYAERKYQSDPEVKGALPGGAGHQAECRAADDLQMGEWPFLYLKT